MPTPPDDVPPVTDAPGVPVHVDGGDLGCARLLVLLRARARELAPGTVVHLTTSDPVAPIDLPAWCRMTGHRYLGAVPEGPPPATYAIEVAATPRETDPARPWHVTPDA